MCPPIQELHHAPVKSHKADPAAPAPWCARPAPVMVRIVLPALGSMVSTSPGSPIATWTRPVAGLKNVTSGGAGDGPDIGDLARTAVDLDKIAGVACGVETSARVIDVETMRAARRKPPLCERAQVRQARHQNHRRLADAEEQPLRRGIGHAPARPAGQVEFQLVAIVESERLQRRRLLFVADAGGDSEREAFDDGGAIRPGAGLEHGFGFERGGVEPAMLADPRLVTRISPSSATAPATPGNPGRVATWRPASGSITSIVLCAVCAMKTRRLFVSKIP